MPGIAVRLGPSLVLPVSSDRLGGWGEGLSSPPSNKPLQLSIPPQGHRVESKHQLGGGLAAERQGVGRTDMTSILAPNGPLQHLQPKVQRRIPWPAIAVGLLLAGLPLAGVLQLEPPLFWTGDHAARYLRYRAFWGGNPNEVYSHWLDMFVLSGNAAVLSGLIALEALLHDRCPFASRFTRECALLAFALSAVGGVVLDSRYGEGGAVVVYSLGFGPVLLASFLLLRRVASLLRWRLLLVLLACGSQALLQFAAQYYCEPSESGAPNVLFTFPWVASLLLLLVRRLWDPRKTREFST